MKNIFKYSLLLFCLAFFSQAALAQNIRLQRAGNIQLDPSIKPTEINAIVQTLESALNEYASAMTLYDENQKRVTEASIDAFEKLFSPGARVVKDYAEFPPGELIDFKDYMLEVYNRLKLKGVEVVIQEAELISIKADALGFFIPVVRVKKRIYNSLSQDNTINSITSGKILDQKISFDISKDDLSRADISKISHGVDIKPADDYVRLISVSPSVGTSAFNPNHSAYWNANHADNALDTRGGLNYSIGAEFLTDRFITGAAQANRNIALSVGLRFSTYSLNADLRAYDIDPFIDQPREANGTPIANADYYRLVSAVSVDEELRVSSLEIPLGIAYRVMKKPTSLVYVHARFIPGFTIGGSGTVAGQGFYDGILLYDNPSTSGIDESEFRIRKMQAVLPALIDDDNSGFGKYRVSDSDQQIDLNTSPEMAGVTFALQLSPTAYFSFTDDNPSLGVIVGLDLTYHLGSYLNHNPIDNVNESAFKYNDDFAGESLWNYYAEGMNGLSFGLRLGIFQRFNAEP